MSNATRTIGISVCLLFASFGLSVLVSNAAAQTDSSVIAPSDLSTIRIATFNVSLYGTQAGQIRSRLSGRDDLQAKQIASIVQTIRPDILLINELDFEADWAPAKLLAKNYFAVAQDDAIGDGKLAPIAFDYLYSAPSNTGIDSELDLNKDGQFGSGNDAWGYGVYPGQYSMTVYSRFPIDTASIRSFQKLLWSDMPGAIRPMDPQTNQPYHDDATWQQLRLSSKNHIDVPVRVGDRVIHVLASHPTPPVFDGPEDRNGARNHDEIQFWNHYLNDDETSQAWLVDDAGRSGGLESDASFVVMGDLNADPIDGDGRREAIRALLSHRRTFDVHPKVNKSDADERIASGQGGDDGRGKTADFGRNGYMRVDFVIPCKNLKVVDSGVFWPAAGNPASKWVQATDHRMVWIEVSR